MDGSIAGSGMVVAASANEWSGGRIRGCAKWRRWSDVIDATDAYRNDVEDDAADDVPYRHQKRCSPCVSDDAESDVESASQRVISSCSDVLFGGAHGGAGKPCVKCGSDDAPIASESGGLE